jgi:topoisomerase-4 subunit B
MNAKTYDAAAIEVLTGLEPVRKRPGMYTDTTRPNHLVQEVIDNSVDEALAGHCDRIDVTIGKDGSVTVIDNGRGMPVDMHPEEGVPGVEVILTRLHAGGKFSNNNYQFSGGLHGVGVSVVNALSKHLEVWVRRDGNEYNMAFANGERKSSLEIVGSVAKRITGTTVKFWPDEKFFDSPKISLTRLRHLLRAKAVLAPGLTVVLSDEKSGETDEWFYQQGLSGYLLESLGDTPTLPAEEPFTGSGQGGAEAVEWALVWLPEGVGAGDAVAESYVNLVPTAQGGTHVNGLRTGLTEALREFCEFRNLLPRGLKLAPEDVWEQAAWILSLKMINSAQRRTRAAKKVERKRITSGPALPGKLADCTLDDVNRTELFLVEGDSAGGSAKQARDRSFQAVMPLRGKILNTWEVESGEILASQEVHDIAVALGVDPGSPDLTGLRYGKVCILADADSDGAHIATLLTALFLRHFRPLVENGHVFVAMPPLYRIDAGKDVFYALDESEKQGVLDRLEAEKRKAKISVTRFKGLGEMNPLQLRETTMAADTRRLVQLSIEAKDEAENMLDMLLAKKRAADRKAWLETRGNLAEV